MPQRHEPVLVREWHLTRGLDRLSPFPVPPGQTERALKETSSFVGTRVLDVGAGWFSAGSRRIR